MKLHSYYTNPQKQLNQYLPFLKDLILAQKTDRQNGIQFQTNNSVHHGYGRYIRIGVVAIIILVAMAYIFYSNNQKI